ncbi:hypothetical protein [Marinobacterium aestuariivivens]|uniref:Cytochrome c domain-containing protein n=1 Tax=Marinobacterium aestuariivivens TaxID=1698799 RepID=A0ABW2A787_9GAMM
MPHDFVPQNQTLGKKHWFHVPMMTSGFFPREPRHGLTRERSLRASEQPWLTSDVGAFGIGLYNRLGGYTIGQVFDDPEPSNANAAASQFIDGTLVVKILFAEYDPAAITGPDPLAHAPAWQIQDPLSNSNGTFEVRLIQMDVAVKDPRATETGWVFATFVYDESLPAATPDQRWYNLTPVGLAWGNDPDVTFEGDPDLDQTWINPAVPAPFNDHVGLHGRLNGPVDNPQSACMSCHSTAQVRDGATSSVGAYTAARLLPDNSCSALQQQHWFRNLSGSEPFGQMTTPPDFCVPADPPVSSPPMRPLDYSLQVQRGLVNGVALDHANPCLAHIPPEQLPAAARQNLMAAVEAGELKRTEIESRSIRPPLIQPVRVVEKLSDWKKVGMQPDSREIDYYPGR